MIDVEPDESGWSHRVRIEPGPGGFAYVPGQVLTNRGPEALNAVQRLFGTRGIELLSPLVDDEGYQQLVGVPDAVLAVRELRESGFRGQLNHVYFADGGAGPCSCDGLHPSAVQASPVYASPVYASPVYASPVYASPVYASPVYASPVYASLTAGPGGTACSPLQQIELERYLRTGRRRSSARPDLTGAAMKMGPVHPPTGVEVVVLDTGLADDPFRPQALVDRIDRITCESKELDIPDGDLDLQLDPAAGHGTFIAGLVERVAPGTSVTLRRVIQAEGDGDELSIVNAIDSLPANDRGVLNLSFSGYVLEEANLLARAIRRAHARGWAVVASAGNDATSRPTYPAALPEVVGVGAVGPCGPAPFTNYGPWVRACAPGVDLISTFFANFDGATPEAGGSDPDRFDGQAVWSGTSFAAPIVAGALAREIHQTGVTAHDAVRRVVDNPFLLRLPHLGTVVNLF